MAPAITTSKNTLASWSGSSVRVAQVLDSLDELRKRAPGTATRTSVVNLVILAHSQEEADHARAITDEMGTHHPARTLFLVVEPQAETLSPSIDATARLYGDGALDHPVWSDEVVLNVRGPAANHLDSLIEPLTLPDLPTVVWFVASIPKMGDPLLRAADVLVVDGKELGATFALATISELLDYIPVVDLSWLRLRPWRELLGRLFESQQLRPFLDDITLAEISGKSAPRHLLLGWIASALNLAPAELRQEDDKHAMICLVSVHGGEYGRFCVERIAGEKLIRASVTIDDEVVHEELFSLPDNSLPWSLAEALTHLEVDTVYRRALTTALTMAS